MELGVVYEVGNCILFYVEGGDGLGVDYVIGCGDDVYFFVDGYYYWIVDFDEVVVVFFQGWIGDLFVWCGQVGEKGDVFIIVFEIVIFLFLLYVGDFDGEVGVGGVFYGYYGFGGW